MAGETLTPEQALRRLGELSAEIRVAGLLHRDGSRAAYSDPLSGVLSTGSREDEKAGDDEKAGEDQEGEGRAARFGGLLRELFERADRASPAAPEQVEAQVGTGAVFALRRRGWTLAVVTDRTALASLMFYDLRSVLEGLAPR